MTRLAGVRRHSRHQGRTTTSVTRMWCQCSVSAEATCREASHTGMPLYTPHSTRCWASSP
ncbi:hypothetical protein ACFP90_06660 [Deinococcus multiflagellatus]|uniref:Uncharacterized protein n=1 Tax=Deinococcus multiflagellatus TaxID=1656887 RepID=A0ABW1ZHX3_9DEIO